MTDNLFGVGVSFLGAEVVLNIVKDISKNTFKDKKEERRYFRL